MDREELIHRNASPLFFCVDPIVASELFFVQGKLEPLRLNVQKVQCWHKKRYRTIIIGNRCVCLLLKVTYLNEIQTC